ncbi:MAG: glycoside hydrolase family 127 protein [Bacteroidales bacterium]|nr:glycoside hydrolase family 127 protein [Bacteroidales bacterium]
MRKSVKSTRNVQKTIKLFCRDSQTKIFHESCQVEKRKESTIQHEQLFVNNVILLLMLMSLVIFSSCNGVNEKKAAHINIAIVGKATSSARPGASLGALNDGRTLNRDETTRTRPEFVILRPGSPWVQYEWERPVIIGETDIFWWSDNNRIRLPKNCIIKYWNGNEFIPVKNQSVSAAFKENEFNNVTFDEISTAKLRLEVETDTNSSAAILEWAVYASPSSPPLPAVVDAGDDRVVLINGKTYLSADIKSAYPLKKRLWITEEAPGKVLFADSKSPVTTATFNKIGEYTLAFKTITSDKITSTSSVKAKVISPPPEKRLEVVYTTRYKINSLLWSARAKVIIVNWIPHCIKQIERTDLKTGQGGLDNFIEAGKALRGEPHGKHKGYVFSNAWVHQTVESMCIALMIDPQGDREIISAQDNMKKTLEKWIPIILAAQEPDGYLHTAWTLRDTTRWKSRWAPETRPNHEGYVAGYFIESAINHYMLTEGKDRRLYDAAKKLADCWADNIGPGKKEWWDEHEEMEQALIRFGRFVNDMEGEGKGDRYIELAKFLMDCRGGGNEYSQSHVPVIQQYEAVGHAVRAVYLYSAMADIAAEKNDVDFHSAAMSLWDNIVNKKYYITGGIGSGETSEGFGPNYSLRNNAYCESCSSCGLIFFQYKMNLAWHDAKFADLYEETMYNALLGALDLEGKNFTYTNELNSSRSRYDWHVCPCCVGNIPRTLLMIPTWTYVKSDSGLYVNMFTGSTIKVDRVAGTDVEMVQETDYPWNGKIKITVNPLESKDFSVFIRIPNRHTSELYSPVPEVNGYKSLRINGENVSPEIIKGYAEIRRTWKKGDVVELELPMEVQTVTADERIEADRGRIALKFGPLVYDVEEVDQKDIHQPVGSGPFISEWNPSLLGGVVVIKGTWADGSTLVAIPYYARNNRNPKPVTEYREGSIVWIKKN